MFFVLFFNCNMSLFSAAKCLCNDSASNVLSNWEMLFSFLFLLLNPFSPLLSSFFQRLLHHPLLLLQVLFLLPKRASLANSERLGLPKQFKHYHHNYHHHHHHNHHHNHLEQHLSALPVPQFGCFRFGQPLCCLARNISCKSMEEYDRPILSYVPSIEPMREVRFGNYCIGRVILPNLVSLNERGEQILQHLGQQGHFRLYNGKRRRNMAANFNDLEETIIQFGLGEQLRERMEDEQWKMDELHAPIVRYSLLSRYLPLKIVRRRIKVPKKVSQSVQKDHWTVSEPSLQMHILTESTTECFCDEFCSHFGDCCANYVQACPPINCEVSEWSEWSKCFSDDAQCGVGTRQRRRTVVRESANAGRKCPELAETIACFKQCFSVRHMNTDLTTVALLLDYQYNSSRRLLPHLFFMKESKNLVMGKNGQQNNTKTKAYVQYCVHYRIIWLHHECTDQKQWRTKLSPGNVICAECQPEAQYHRSVSRCASDLEDGQRGFWKLIGPKYCYGIWLRLYSSGNTPPSLDCKCSKHFSQLSPFLMV